MVVESSKPKKQRKFFYSMPLHRRQKSFACALSGVLRERLGRRSMPLRRGDKVRVMRGTHRGFEGKVIRVDFARGVFLEKLSRKRSDGTERPIPLHPSNLVIVDLDRSDSRRVSGTRGKPREAVGESVGRVVGGEAGGGRDRAVAGKRGGKKSAKKDGGVGKEATENGKGGGERAKAKAGAITTKRAKAVKATENGEKASEEAKAKQRRVGG